MLCDLLETHLDLLACAHILNGSDALRELL
jgi:hypothetical protein